AAIAGREEEGERERDEGDGGGREREREPQPIGGVFVAERRELGAHRPPIIGAGASEWEASASERARRRLRRGLVPTSSSSEGRTGLYGSIEGCDARPGSRA